MTISYHKKELEQAKTALHLIELGAEVAICKIVQTGNFNPTEIERIGEALANAKSRVAYQEKDLAEHLAEKPQDAEEMGDE